MLKRATLALFAVIACVLIVRTWRFEHAAVREEDLGQYLHDKIEIDRDFFSRGPTVASFGTQGESLEHVLRRFTEATGIPVVVRWEALARAGVQPNRVVDAMNVASATPDYLLRSVSAEGDFFEGYKLFAIRCRHGAVVISTQADFRDDVVWRSYPVQDLMDGYKAFRTTGSALHSSSYPNPAGDTEEFLAFVEIFNYRPWDDLTSHHADRVRVVGGVLQVQAELEDHAVLFVILQYIRKECMTGGVFDLKKAERGAVRSGH